jgi:hypothetical protein
VSDAARDEHGCEQIHSFDRGARLDGDDHRGSKRRECFEAVELRPVRALARTGEGLFVLAGVLVVVTLDEFRRRLGVKDEGIRKHGGSKNQPIGDDHGA